MSISFGEFIQIQEGTGPKARILRFGDRFEAWVRKKKVGQAYISSHDNKHFILDAIDVEEDEQRKGYATQILQVIAKYLKNIGALSLNSSNEGSGTVQILDRVFGRQNVKHYHGGEEIDFDSAVKIMDVDYGYTKSSVSLPTPKPKKPERPL